MRIQVLTQQVRRLIFWDVTPCTLVETYRRFRGTFCFHHRLDDVSSKRLRNVSQFLADYTARHNQ